MAGSFIDYVPYDKRPAVWWENAEYYGRLRELKLRAELYFYAIPLEHLRDKEAATEIEQEEPDLLAWFCRPEQDRRDLVMDLMRRMRDALEGSFNRAADPHLVPDAEVDPGPDPDR